MTFVRNAWYMAAWAAELQSGPRAIIMLDEPIVLFRNAERVAGALYDVCPHRAVPLSMGTVAGDTIICPYHGLEFDVAGICRKNPHVKGPSDRLSTRAFPVVERHGIIWLWLGDKADADAGLIPDFGIFATPDAFAVGRGYLHIAADYRLIIDNLMDLAHADYIHPDTVGQPGAAEVQQAAVVREGNTIGVRTLWPDLPPSALHRQAWTRTERVDKYLDMTWRPASNLFLDLGVMAPGTPRESGIRTPSIHLLTPETEKTTHYFWAVARDFDRENDVLTQRLEEIVGRAFSTEDKPMIEAAQRVIDRTGAKLRSFTTGDSGSTLIRRELDRRAAQEQGGSQAA